MPTFTDIQEYVAARRYKALVRMLKGDGLTDEQIPLAMDSFTWAFEGYKDDLCEEVDALGDSGNEFGQDLAYTVCGLLMFEDMLDRDSLNPHKEELFWDALNGEVDLEHNLRHVSRMTPAHVSAPEVPFGAGLEVQA